MTFIIPDQLRVPYRMFDVADGNTAASGGSNAGAIAGAVIGVLVVVGVVCAVIIYFVRKRSSGSASIQRPVYSSYPVGTTTGAAGGSK